LHWPVLVVGVRRTCPLASCDGVAWNSVARHKVLCFELLIENKLKQLIKKPDDCVLYQGYVKKLTCP